MPPPPEPSLAGQLSLLAKEFMEGATEHKQSSESATPSVTSKFLETQLTQLMGWCGLGPGQQDKMPLIWVKLQETKDKEDTQAVLTKYFKRLSGNLEEPLHLLFGTIGGGPAEVATGAELGARL